MKKFDIFADDIIMTFIKLAGYFCLFFAGYHLALGINDALFVALGGFIISRIYINVLERLKGDE